MIQPAALPDPVDARLGARVRLLRKLRGLSQQGLAEACGVTFQQIQKYERGANRVSASMLTRIAAALSTSVSDLLGEADAAGSAVDALAHLLAWPGAVELLQSYGALRSRQARTALVEMVAAVVTADGLRPDDVA